MGSATDETRRKTMGQPTLDPQAGQTTGAPSASLDWRHPLWLVLLVGASIVFSLGLACGVPLAAFAAAVALSLSRRDAVLVILLVWLANQLVGFTLLDYPWTASTVAWGAALGAVAVLATWAGQSMARCFQSTARGITVAATFLVAFAVYEAALFAISATLLGGAEIYTLAIQGRIFAINAAAFVGLLVLNQLAASIGLARKPLIRLPITEQHA
jgi:hypothetical protein